MPEQNIEFLKDKLDQLYTMKHGLGNLLAKIESKKTRAVYISDEEENILESVLLFLEEYIEELLKQRKQGPNGDE